MKEKTLAPCRVVRATVRETSTITLPQGGGAIRGIDEKSNPVTGAGALTVPITVEVMDLLGRGTAVWCGHPRYRATSAGSFAMST